MSHNRLHLNDEKKVYAQSKPKVNKHVSFSEKPVTESMRAFIDLLMRRAASLLSISTQTLRPLEERAMEILDRT